jgi:hypothetical protein
VRNDGLSGRSLDATTEEEASTMSTPVTVDVDQLQRELAALKGQLAAEKSQRTAKVRTVFTWILAVLAVLATVFSLMSLWTLRTLTNTDLFVDRVGSVIEDPAVAQVIGERAAEQLVTALDLQQRITEVLPPEAAVVAGPITSAAQNYLAQGATKLVQTEQFQQAWDKALAAGHELTIGILSGTDTTAITNDNGVIVLNLTPVVNALLAEGSDFLSGLLNKPINPPTVTADTIDSAISGLENALGVDLPADFGTVTLFSSQDLAAAQSYYQLARVAAWLTPIAALMLIGLALAVAKRRLRTFLGIVIGTALLLLFVGLSLNPIESAVVGAVSDSGLQGAVQAAFGTVTSSLLTGITVVVVLGVLAALLFFLLGDSKPAHASRDALKHSASLAARHRGIFLGGGAVAALVLLAIIPGRTFGQLLFVGLLYAAFALMVMLAPRVAEDEPTEAVAVTG